MKYRPGFVYWFSFYFSKFLAWIFAPVRVAGGGHVPQGKPFILASNHLSNLDPVLIRLHTGCHLSFLAKDSLFQNKIFGALLLRLGAFPLKRGRNDIGALKEALRRLKTGEPLLVFPEGTRGGKKIFSGVGFLAAKSGLPVVPAKITGSDLVLPRGAIWPRRRQITLTFGPPSIFLKSSDYEQITGEIVEAIRGL